LTLFAPHTYSIGMINFAAAFTVFFGSAYFWR
jgi:hypothetical protein